LRYIRRVFLFGGARASLGLPLRISVWEDADGKVWVGSPNLETIASEYGMENSGVIEKMQEAVTNIVSKSIAGSR